MWKCGKKNEVLNVVAFSIVFKVTRQEMEMCIRTLYIVKKESTGQMSDKDIMT